jgi:hypothetical protein
MGLFTGSRLRPWQLLFLVEVGVCGATSLSPRAGRLVVCGGAGPAAGAGGSGQAHQLRATV